MPVAVRISYRSDLDFDGPFGFGWSSNITEFLTYDDALDQLLCFTSSGRLDVYSNAGTVGVGPYVRDGVPVEITRDDGGTSGVDTDDVYELVTNEGNVKAFESTNVVGGQRAFRPTSLKSLADVASGLPGTVMLYDSKGRLTEMRGDLYNAAAPTLNRLVFGYNVDDRVDYIEDWADYTADAAVIGSSFTGPRRIDFDYSSGGDLERIWLPKTEDYNTSVVGDSDARRMFYFTYDGSRNLLEVHDPNSSNVSSGAFGLIRNTYVGGEVVSQDLGRTSSADTTHRHHIVKTSATEFSVVTAEGLRSDYRLNSDGTLQSKKQYSGAWDSGLTQIGTAVQSGAPAYTEVEFEYDLHFNVTRTTAPSMGPINRLFDTSSHLTQNNVLRIHLEPEPTMLATVPANQQNGVLYRFEYNADGRLTKSISPRAYSLPAAWAIGDPIPGGSSEAVFTTTTTYYSGDPVVPDGMIKEVTRPAIDASVSPGSPNTGDTSVESFEYNQYGQLTAYTDGEGYRTENIYGVSGNELGRLIERRKVSSSGNHSEHYTYNSVGETSSYTNIAGNIFKTTFDQSGHIVRWENPPATYHGNAVYYRRASYDRNGNLLDKWTANIDRNGVTLVPAEVQESFTYNKLGQEESATSDVSSTSTITTDYVYDRDYRLVETVLPEGNKSGIDIDEWGRTARTYWGYDDINILRANALSTTETHFGDGGHIESFVNGSGSSATYEYDAYGRLIKETSRLALDPAVKNYTYDREDNNTSFEIRGRMRDYTGANSYAWSSDRVISKIEVDYDNWGRRYRSRRLAADEDGTALGYSSLESATNSDLGYMTFIVSKHKNGLTEYNEDDLGRRTQFEYDDHWRVDKVLKPAVGGATNNSIERIFDSAGNLSEVKVNSVNPITLGTTSMSAYYTWDSLQRLVSVSRNGNVRNTRFDSFSRVTYEETPGNGLTKTSEYDMLGRMTKTFDQGLERWDVDPATGFATVSAGNSFGAAFEYDDNSNLTKRISGLGNSTEIRYDLAHRWLQTVRADDPFGGTSPGELTAGPDHVVTAASGSPFFIEAGAYRGDGVLLEMTDSNGTVRSYTYNNDGHLVSESADTSGALANGFQVYGRDTIEYELNSVGHVGVARTKSGAFTLTETNTVRNTLGKVSHHEQGVYYQGLGTWYRNETISRIDELGRRYQRDMPNAEVRSEWAFDELRRATETYLYDWDAGSSSYIHRAGLTGGLLMKHVFAGPGRKVLETTRYHTQDPGREILSEHTYGSTESEVLHTIQDLGGGNEDRVARYAYGRDTRTGMKAYEARWFGGGTGSIAEEVDFFFHNDQKSLVKAIYNAEQIDISNINTSAVAVNNIAHSDRTIFGRRLSMTRDYTTWYKGGLGAVEPDDSHTPDQVTSYATSEDETASPTSPLASGIGSLGLQETVGQIELGYDANSNVIETGNLRLEYTYDDHPSRVTRKSDGATLATYATSFQNIRVSSILEWERARTVTFDTRVETNIDLDEDMNLSDIEFENGGAYSSTPSAMETLSLNSLLSNADREHYFDGVIAVPDDSRNLTIPYGYFAYESYAVYIYRDRIELAQKDVPAIVYATAFTSTSGVNNLGIHINQSLITVNWNGTAVASHDASASQVHAIMTFGSRATRNGNGATILEFQSHIRAYDTFGVSSFAQRSAENSQGSASLRESEELEGEPLSSDGRIVVFQTDGSAPGATYYVDGGDQEVGIRNLGDGSVYDILRDGVEDMYHVLETGRNTTGVIVSGNTGKWDSGAGAYVPTIGVSYVGVATADGIIDLFEAPKILGTNLYDDHSTVNHQSLGLDEFADTERRRGDYELEGLPTTLGFGSPIFDPMAGIGTINLEDWEPSGPFLWDPDMHLGSNDVLGKPLDWEDDCWCDGKEPSEAKTQKEIKDGSWFPLGIFVGIANALRLNEEGVCQIYPAAHSVVLMEETVEDVMGDPFERARQAAKLGPNTDVLDAQISAWATQSRENLHSAARAAGDAISNLYTEMAVARSGNEWETFKDAAEASLGIASALLAIPSWGTVPAAVAGVGAAGVGFVDLKPNFKPARMAKNQVEQAILDELNGALALFDQNVVSPGRLVAQARQAAQDLRDRWDKLKDEVARQTIMNYARATCVFPAWAYIYVKEFDALQEAQQLESDLQDFLNSLNAPPGAPSSSAFEESLKSHMKQALRKMATNNWYIGKGHFAKPTRLQVVDGEYVLYWREGVGASGESWKPVARDRWQYTSDMKWAVKYLNEQFSPKE